MIMGKNSIENHAQMYQYLQSVSVRETDTMRKLRQETVNLPDHMMQISPDQGQFMAMIVKLIDARRIVEIGTFTGYSALCMAMALPTDGQLVACDISDEWTGIGKRYWHEAGVASKIDLRIAPALETLEALLADGLAGKFDLAFIDADKPAYQDYYERCVELIRPNGLIMIDNVFWEGKVVDPNDQDKDTVAIRNLNASIARDNRVEVSMIAVGDGLSLVRKK